MSHDSLQPLLNGLKAADSDERRSAAKALGESGDSQAIAPLIYALNDPDPTVNQAIQEALAHFGSKAVEPLMAIARSIDANVQAYIARIREEPGSTPNRSAMVIDLVWRNWSSLGLNENDNNLDQMLSGELRLMMFQNGKTTEVDSGSATSNLRNIKLSKVIAQTLSKLGSTAYSAILPYLTYEAVVVRWIAARALSGVKTADVTTALSLASSDQASIVREAVLTSLTDQGQPLDLTDPAILASQTEASKAAVHTLLFGKVDGMRRHKMARNLANFGDLALAHLLEVVHDENQPEKVRIDAIWLLGQYKNPGAIEPLIGLLNDSAPAIRSQVAWVFGWLKDVRAVEPLLKLFSDQNQELSVQEKVVQALGDLRDKRAVPVLLKELSSTNVTLRSAAIHSLGKIGGSGAVEPLIQLLTDSDAEIRKQAASALGSIKDSRAFEPLLALVTPQGPSYVIHALGALGDKRATPILVNFLNSNNAQLRDEAAWMLGKLRDQEAVEPLIRALQDPVSEVRYGAVSALGMLEDERVLPALERTRQEDKGYHPNSGEPISEAAQEAIERIKNKRDGQDKTS